VAANSGDPLAKQLWEDIGLKLGVGLINAIWLLNPDRLDLGYEHRKIRVGALADFHYTKASAGQLKDVFVRASETADVLAVCGDMTDYGLPEEAAVLARDIKSFVLGSITNMHGQTKYSPRPFGYDILY